MKAKNCLLLKIFAIAILLVVGIGALFFQPIFSTFADNTIEISIPENGETSDFSMRVTVNFRDRNLEKDLETKVVQNETTGEEIEFYYFKWRELESLSFRFTTNSNRGCLSHYLMLTYMQSEDLSPYIGEGNSEVLYEGEGFIPFNFFYYIDSTTENKNNPNTSSGKDFGLYKFDFVYTFQQDGQITSRHKELYVAVVPDTVEEVVESLPANTSIIPTVGSNKLMTIYNLTLTTAAHETLKYVNPARLKWEVFGRDTESINYCLDSDMKEKMEYGSYEMIYPNPLPEEKKTGTSFVLDTNDIEGTWTVNLILKKSDGSEMSVAKIENLSTKKAERKSYLWLILVIISVVLLAIAIILIIIFVLKKKKDRKVW